MWVAGLVTVALALFANGCRPAAPVGGGAPAAAPRAEESDAAHGEAVADPALREAREQADEVLGRLLAGEFDKDPDLWPVARKLKGFRSCKIKSQKIKREGAAEFRGVLDSQTGRIGVSK